MLAQLQKVLQTAGTSAVIPDCLKPAADISDLRHKHYHSCPELRLLFGGYANNLQITRLDWYPSDTVHEIINAGELANCASLWFEPGRVIANFQEVCNLTEFSDAELALYGLDITVFPGRATEISRCYLAGYIRVLSLALAAVLDHRLKNSSECRKCFPLARKVENIILMHYGDPDLSIDKIAGMLRISGNYLSVCYKTETGKTIHDALLDFRLQRAKKLLLDHGLSVKDAAFRCGFSQPGYFATAFRRMVGFSPSEYRKNHLKLKFINKEVCNEQFG